MPVEIEWKLRAAAFCRVLGMLQGPDLGVSWAAWGLPGRLVLHTAGFGCAKLCGAQSRLTRECFTVMKTGLIFVKWMCYVSCLWLLLT